MAKKQATFKAYTLRLKHHDADRLEEQAAKADKSPADLGRLIILGHLNGHRVEDQLAELKSQFESDLQTLRGEIATLREVLKKYLTKAETAIQHLEMGRH
jgi:hypothetical protein